MGKLKAGWAERDITPKGPSHIPGHHNMRISEGVVDPLTTTALVLENGGDVTVFVSIDGTSMRKWITDEIRGKAVNKCPQLTESKIIAFMTHSHNAASHYYDGGKLDETLIERFSEEQLKKELETYIPQSFMDVPRPGMQISSSDEYRDYVAEQVSDAIIEAYETRRETGIAYGYGYAVVAHSRRTVYFDDYSKRPGVELNSLTAVHGHAVMYGNTDDEQFSHYEAGADHTVNVMFAFDTEKKLTGAVINIPCPSQCSESEYSQLISADYWHDVKKAVREKLGNIPILAQCAAGGDLSPRILHYKKAQNRRFMLKYGVDDVTGRVEELARRDIAERVCFAVEEIYSWAKNDIDYGAALAHEVRTLELERRDISEEQYNTALESIEQLKKEPFKFDIGSAKENLDYNSILKSKRNRFVRIAQRYEASKIKPTFSAEVHAVKVGNIAFATSQFELYMDFMHRIQARSPFAQTFIVQLCGQPDGRGSGSYLATERGVAGKGYSASVFCNAVSPEGGQRLVEETLSMLSGLK
ncbi:MAG: hypothetical protein GX633_01680 [Clostridiales bacterium]|nr:hypothetical protein [Clostridiales bacterium]